MTNHQYNLWTLTERGEDDAQVYLEVIVANAELGVVQAIQYQQKKVFIISEQQYDQVKEMLNRTQDKIC